LENFLFWKNEKKNDFRSLLPKKNPFIVPLENLAPPPHLVLVPVVVLLLPFLLPILSQAMATIVRKLVSKKKKRFMEAGFNLDLSCKSFRPIIPLVSLYPPYYCY